MKKIFFCLVAILFLVSSVALAAPATKTIQFGPHQYRISEHAPDFSSWEFNLIGQMDVTLEPNPCSLFLIEATNPSRTVGIRILIVKEGGAAYIAGIIVMYRPEDGGAEYGDCYEDLQYFSGGKPSFVLTKIDTPSNIEKFIQMKRAQRKVEI